MRQRDAAYKAARISGNLYDWERYRQLRNKTVDTCRKEKREYLEKKLDKNRKDPKRMWMVLKEMLKGKEAEKEYREMQCGNEIISHVREMANKFNWYFVHSIKMLGDTNSVLDQY